MVLEAATSTPEHGRTPKERSLSLLQWPLVVHAATTTRAARARAPQVRVLRLLPRERERALAPAPRETRRRLLGVGGRISHVGARPYVERERRLAGVDTFHRAWSDSNQRSAARACRKCACCASSRDKERAQQHLRPATRGACSALEAAFGTSEHGRTPKERCLSLVKCPSKRHGPTLTCEARRARTASARAAPSPERERERSGACATRDAALLAWCWRSHSTRRSTAVPRKRALLGGVVSFQGAWSDSNQRSAACVRRKCACCASSRERERVQWRLRHTSRGACWAL